MVGWVYIYADILLPHLETLPSHSTYPRPYQMLPQNDQRAHAEPPDKALLHALTRDL